MEQLDNLTPERPSRKKYIWTYSIMSAMIFIILLLITHIFREQLMDKNFLMTGVYFIVLIIVVIMAQIQIRAKVYGGIMTYGQAFSSAMLVCVFSALMYAVFAFIFYQFIAPGVLDEMLAYTEQQMREKGTSEDMIERAMKFTKLFMSPVGVLISTIFGHMIMGTIAALLASLFTQRQR